MAYEAEYLIRHAAAAATSERYLFLTDDSGIGFSHAEPTISCCQVTLLSDLMVRVLYTGKGRFASILLLIWIVAEVAFKLT